MTVSEMQKVLSEYPPDAEVSLTAAFDEKRGINQVRMIVARDENLIMSWTLYNGPCENMREKRAECITFIE